eukprot:CAMPEP_0170410026 /NCGR_PEP_ID=MMETSP0117_2-20130122/29660_1 /TAXON_ID=400756 /ORGANISM="Durinskia baltica, Strain CSIRO CS-38" /LENGTH=80 /DNA_ID=CAMNT_0010667511 /DNA_START=174 /DNA_END=412 /DNA_ORIENTATION=-
MTQSMHRRGCHAQSATQMGARVSPSGEHVTVTMPGANSTMPDCARASGGKARQHANGRPPPVYNGCDLASDGVKAGLGAR